MSRKSTTAKKSQAAKKGTRRSSSVFTSVSDALVMSDARPSRIETVELVDDNDNVEGYEYDVYARKGNGWKLVTTCASMSAARRARSRIDADASFRPTAKQIASARKLRDKSKA